MPAIEVKKPAIAETGSTLYAFLHNGSPMLVEIGSEGMAYSKVFAGNGMLFNAGVAYSGDEELHDKVCLLQQEDKGKIVNIDRLVIHDAALLAYVKEEIRIVFAEGKNIYESGFSTMFEKPELVLFDNRYATSRNIRLESSIILHVDPTMKDAYNEEIKKLARHFFK
ncbi:MAG: hypothetical protein ACP5K9_02855 [Candidatus Micrarchaeia archaeon]